MSETGRALLVTVLAGILGLQAATSVSQTSLRMAMAIATTMAIIPRKKLIPRRACVFGKSCWTLTRIILATPWSLASRALTPQGEHYGRSCV